ncbi:hypothetical protein HS088_TW22G00518 [Tripterygium wilfordii]|uniref:Uncharacterized protein n=1 Tax=Tripterygium wilfordii TaxID=458696 RepID=A0A7J7BY93_TRIWF|nr:hypothetical protein HS088_TW22G00518 [Tripterygium wilfordii]
MKQVDGGSEVGSKFSRPKLTFDQLGGKGTGNHRSIGWYSMEIGLQVLVPLDHEIHMNLRFFSACYQEKSEYVGLASKFESFKGHFIWFFGGEVREGKAR